MDRQVWETDIREAVQRDDHEALRELFSRAVDAWGHEQASRHWQEIFSALDADAQTG